MRPPPGQKGFIGCIACVAATIPLCPANSLARPLPVGVREAIYSCVDPKLSQEGLREELLLDGWKISTQSPIDARMLMGSHMVVISVELEDHASDLLSQLGNAMPVWQGSADYLRHAGQDADVLLESRWHQLSNDGYRICTFAVGESFELDPLENGVPFELIASEAGKSHYRDSSPYGADIIVFDAESPFLGVIQVIEAQVALAPEAVE